MPDEPFDPWASAAADGTSAAVMKSGKKKDVWGSFKAGEAEALSDSEAKPGKQGKKKKGGDGKKPSGPSGPNLARHRVTESKVSGIVESWTNSYGWIRPFQRVNHPKAGKHGGKIYIHGKDVKGMGFLPVGAPVEFYVFEDDAGLGAEECSVTEGKGKGNKGWGWDQGWDMGKGWDMPPWDMGKGWDMGKAWGGKGGWDGGKGGWDGGKKGWDSGKGGKGKSTSKGGKGESSGKDRKGPKGEGKGESKGKDFKDHSKGRSKGASTETPEVRSDWSGYTGVVPGSQGFDAAKGSQACGDTSRAAPVVTAVTGAPPPPPMMKQIGAAPMMPGLGASLPAAWPEARPAPCAPFMMGGVGTAPVPTINSVAVNPVAYPQYNPMMPGMSPPMPGMSPPMPQPLPMNPPGGALPGMYGVPGNPAIQPPHPTLGGPGVYEDAGAGWGGWNAL